MPVYRLKNSGSWRKLSRIYRLKANGTWRSLAAVYRLKSNGIWKKVFGSVSLPTISQEVEISKSSPNATTGFITLTGTNYYWTNATSLQYRFQWYNLTTWQTINSGSITNPAVGSSNTKTYTVQIIDTNTNTDNLYRFVVVATNSSGSSDSTSNTVTISTPRNITNVTASQVGTTKQATVSFTAGLYTNSVIITRYKYNGATLEAFTEYHRTTASPATIPLDEYGKTYRFTVTPYTGSLVSGNVTGYVGNSSSLTSAFTSTPPPAPIPITRPSLSPTGSVLPDTQLTATTGTYEADSFYSKTIRVMGWATPPTLVNGSTTFPNPNSASTPSSLTSSLTPSQININYTYYAVDTVVSADQSTTYYYYSELSAIIYMPSFSDNFNRTNTTGSQGIGRTSTGNWYWSQVGNFYGYQNPSNQDLDNISWQINNNTAYNGYTTPFSASPTGYPMKSINVGDSNVSIQASIPDGGGGPGLAFWVTGSGSWWAVAPSYYRQDVTVTTYPCSDGPYTHTSTTCPTTYPGSTTVGQICSCTAGSSTTTYNCTGGPVDALSCPAGPYSTTAANLGLRCSSCTTVTSTTCTGSGICAGEGCCPTSGSANGQRCSACTAYKICDVYEQVFLSSGSPLLGTGCGDRCTCTGPLFTAGTSTCGPTVQEFSNPGSSTFACVTAADAGKVCEVTFIGSSWLVKRCVVGTASQRYYDCTKNRCGSTYNTNETSTYQRYNTVASSTTTVNASYYKVTTGTATTTTYYSRIRLLSANGSSVISVVDHAIQNTTSASGYAAIPIRGLKVETTNNTISAYAYSNEAATTQVGSTLIHTATNPTKMLAGESAVGIINTPTDENRITGNRLDNFIYTNV